MATKASFITTVNGFLTAIITVLKHRNSMLEVINELWKTSLNDTQSSTNVITKTFASATYNLDFNKVGNKVYVSGTVNVFGVITFTTSDIYATFTNSELAPKTGKIFYINGSELGGTKVFALSFNGTTGEIKSTKSLNPISNYTINGWYQTND
jgi:hypothetical protein